MSLKNLKAVVFDVDGTLVDSNDLHAQAWADAFGEFGVTLEWNEIRSQIGKGGDLLVPDLLGAREMRKFGEELRERRGAIFRERYLERVQPFPDAAAVIRELHQRGARIALASSADPDEVEHHLERLGIGELVDVATSKGDVETSKPSPDIFEAAMEKLGEGNAIVVVGDTPYDILAAHRLALPIVGVRSGGFPDETLGRAEFLLDSVGDIPGILSEIDGWFEQS